jgi:hypothetical protein
MALNQINRVIAAAVAGIVLLGGAYLVWAWTALPVVQDHLVRMPGTQPGQVFLQAPDRCFNCHGNYSSAVEPGFNWRGSMMAQSSRDFLFWTCMAAAAQDSIWAVGRPNATDICERCHFPAGWLDGRSDTTNASAMVGADFDGVSCDLCHRLWDPFFETTWAGTREGADWVGYWDETNLSATPSQPAADATHAQDSTLAQAIRQFNGDSFFAANLPPSGYTESASGQYYIGTAAEKRASFADSGSRHPFLYSRFHKSRYFCSTCHDVSNPILANLGADPTQPLPSEVGSAFTYFHVERTFSEFMLSDYGLQGGAATNPEFQSQGAPNVIHAAKCQDCHMRDVAGVAAFRGGLAVTRPDGSIEHPQSGLPLHDLTGGNAWVSWVLASAIPGSPIYDGVNDSLLNQGPAVLTLDLTQGLGLDPAATLAGVDRAVQQLQLAATIQNATYDPATGSLAFRILNNTGHKLISGFPEGRRMYANIRLFAGGSLVYEINPYDAAAGTLKGISYPYVAGMGLPNPLPLGASEAHLDELVYEMKPTSALTGEVKTFHFALATGRYKDIRIPPKGFRVSEAAERLAVPVWHGVEDPAYFTADEYAGGYDDVSITVPPGADQVEINLYYQTTSREYVEFLRDEINGTGNLTLSSPTPSGEPEAYIVQTDPFFASLRAWGDTLWGLWTHNMDIPGAAPLLMASATTVATPGCSAPTPTLLSGLAGHGEITLAWSDEHSADPQVTGYNLYYDQAGHVQLVAALGLTTSYTDAGLTNGLEYCFTVSSSYAGCESALSNILCAIPTNQAGLVGVSLLVSVGGTVFTAGGVITFEATVVDHTGAPVSGAVVGLAVSGPSPATLTTGTSGADGIATASWQTRRMGPNRTLPGAYTVTVTGVALDGAVWDGVPTSTSVTIQ